MQSHYKAFENILRPENTICCDYTQDLTVHEDLLRKLCIIVFIFIYLSYTYKSFTRHV